MLWIFTQNKQSVVHVKEVAITGKTIKGILNSSTLDEWSTVLGKYDSKERAMEILREIFLTLEQNNNHTITYDMPET